MDAAFEAHRRYLTTLRDACARRPALHRHQLLALERELALAAGAADLRGYLRASGDVFEVSRAAWLDRLANRAAAAAATGDPGAAGGSAAEYARAVAATGHDDWAATLAAAGAEAEPIVRRGIGATTAFTRLLLSLLAFHTTGGDAARAEARAAAAAALRALLEADPEFASDSSSRDPRYALRVPWAARGKAVVGRWLVQLGAPTAASPSAQTDPLDAIASAERTWRSRLDAASDGGGGPAILEAIRAYRDPRDVAREAAARVRAAAEAALTRQATWPDPLVRHHWESLLEALADVRTLTELDAVTAHAEACFAVEADWNLLFLTSLLAPLRAAFAYGWAATPDAEEAVGFAAGATFVLYGVGPRTTLRVPRVAEFVAEALAPQLAGSAEIGAFRGEGGADVVREARAWAAATATASSGPERLESAARDLFDAVGTREPPPSPQHVMLWRDSFSLDDAVTALARPPRPRIPDAEPVPGAGTAV